MAKILPSECRLIVEEEPRSGHENMALDAALLHAADQDKAAPVVRIYQWDRPTISLGYFQKDDPANIPTALKPCPRVRRLTGGGAILHDQEITYSCAIAGCHRIAANPADLYHVIHDAIRECLAVCGAEARFRAELPLTDTASVGTTIRKDQEFLCFLRSDPRDLAVNSSRANRRPKIVGSAQRRRRSAVLQHGSVLMSASPLAPEIPGLSNVFPDFDEIRFKDLLPDRLGKVLAQSVRRDEFSETETGFAFEYGEQILQNGESPDDLAYT